MYLHAVRQFFNRHLEVIFYTVGSALVAIWTLLRFFSERTIFDLVGQQLLTHQWLHGNIEGAQLGVTHYIPKMLLLYTPLDALPGSPRLHLVLLTIFINIATFIGIGILLKKLLIEFTVDTQRVHIALLWLATVVGSVFWIHFANSRNLEVLGGMLFLLLGIRLLKAPTKDSSLLLMIFAGVLFFADSLQVYMTTLPLLCYAAYNTWRDRRAWQAAATLSAIVVGGLVFSKLLFILVAHVFSITFLQPDNTSLSLSVTDVSHTIKAYVHLYAGGADAGRIREILNIIFICGMFTLFIYGVIRKRINSQLAVLSGFIIIIDSAIYFVSGQANQPTTERYLIMTLPALLLVVASASALVTKHQSKSILYTCVMFLFAFNFLSLSKVLADNWNTAFPKDNHLMSVVRYERAHSQSVTYASMDTAIPADYLSNASLLPLTCVEGHVYKNNTFFDKAAFKKNEVQARQNVAIIFDGAQITNTPHVCTIDSTIKQLGLPLQLDHTDDGSIVAMYPQAIIHELRY
jgi:hypothetical protein